MTVETWNKGFRTWNVSYQGTYGTGSQPSTNAQNLYIQTKGYVGGSVQRITSVRRPRPILLRPKKTPKKVVKTYIKCGKTYRVAKLVYERRPDRTTLFGEKPIVTKDPNFLKLHPNPCIIFKNYGEFQIDTVGVPAKDIISGRFKIIGPNQHHAGGTWLALEGYPVPLIVNYSTTPIWSTSLSDLSLLKAHADMNSAKVDGLVELSQLKMTLDLIHKPMKTLVKLFMDTDKTLLRISPKYRAKHNLQDLLKDSATSVSNAWLQYIYGWAPTVGTISDIVSEFRDKVPNCTPFLRARKKVRTRSKKVYTYERNLAGFALRFLVTEEEVRTATTVLHYSIDTGSMDKYGFTPYDLVNVVYENIPFSFVANWFLTLDDWINAYRNVKPTLSSCTTCTVKKTITHTLVGAWWASYPLEKVSFRAYSVTQGFRGMERRVGLPVPSLPRVQAFFMNYDRQSTSAALLWQKASKFFKRN